MPLLPNWSIAIPSCSFLPTLKSARSSIEQHKLCSCATTNLLLLRFIVHSIIDCVITSFRIYCTLGKPDPLVRWDLQQVFHNCWKSIFQRRDVVGQLIDCSGSLYCPEQTSMEPFLLFWRILPCIHQDVPCAERAFRSLVESSEAFDVLLKCALSLGSVGDVNELLLVQIFTPCCNNVPCTILPCCT